MFDRIQRTTVTALIGAVVLTGPASVAHAQSAAEWTPAFGGDAIMGAIDRRSIRRLESHSFPVGADVRRIRAAVVTKEGARFGATRHDYVIADADVACDRNEIMWVREEYFDFGRSGPGDVLTPSGAVQRRIDPGSIDAHVATAACTDAAPSGETTASADRFAVLAMVRLVGDTPRAQRTGWAVADASPQRVIALNLGSIGPARGQYAGGDLLQAVTVTLTREGVSRDGAAHDYVMETHLIRCRAGMTATAFTHFYDFNQPDAPADTRRTVGPQLEPIRADSAGALALVHACGLTPSASDASELRELMPTLRGLVGR